MGGAGGRRRVSGLSSSTFEAWLRSERERREDPLFPSPPFAERERARELEREEKREREREREREKELCSRRHFFLFLALYLEKSRALFNNPPPLLLF